MLGGVRKIKGAGGTVIVQDPTTSAASGMPSAAIVTGSVDFVLPLGTIPAALVSPAIVRGGAYLFGSPTPPSAA